MNIYFDEHRIDDMEYVTERIRELDWTKELPAPFDWLNPIRQMLNPKSLLNIENQ